MVLFSWPTAIAYLQVSYTTVYCQDYFPTQDKPRYTPLCMPLRSLISYTCSISHKFDCIACIVSFKRSILLTTVCIIYFLHTTTSCICFIIMICLYLLSHYCEVYMYYHLEIVMKLHYLETLLPLSKCSFIACNPIHTCNYTIFSYHLYTEVMLCMRIELIYYCICLLVMYCLYTHLLYNALYFETMAGINNACLNAR